MFYISDENRELIILKTRPKMGCGDTSSTDVAVPVGQADEGGLDHQIFIDDGLSNPVEVHISCENLADLDVMSKSDPMAVLYLYNNRIGKWTMIGHTEMIKNNLNPIFVKAITLKYNFEEKQRLRVEVYDIDHEENLLDFSKQELIGTCELLLSDAIRAKGQTWKASLLNPKRPKNGTVTLKIEQLSKKMSGDLVKLVIEGELHRKRNNFFRLLRAKDNSSEFIPVYQSESAKFTGNTARWNPVKVGAAGLMRDDPNYPLAIEIYEYKGSGDHIMLGNFKFTFAQLVESVKWTGSFGTIMCKSAELFRRPTFVEYLFGGCNLSLAIGIDFTASNGDPSLPGSLHNYNPQGKTIVENQYLSAINAVGGIMLEYDTDKNVPLLGFGALLPYTTGGSYCFAVNGNIFSPEIHGLEQISECYRKALSKVKLYGPTNFAPIIRYIGDIAEFHVKNNLLYNYFVLLIITDGQISDIDDTIDEVVRCSTLPVSIIIIGVGNEDFNDMERLDADVNPLYSNRYQRKMARDIVQFVPFKKYATNPPELARQTLAELPRQFVDYMVSMKIFPGVPTGVPAVPTDIASVYALRKADFANRVAQYAPPDQIERLLAVGFPTEDPTQFLYALQRGFVNVLAN